MFTAQILLIVVVLAAFVVSDSSRRSHAGLLLVANKGEHTIGLIDPGADRQMATVPESGVTGHEVVASPDGKLAFVPIYGNSGVGMPGTDGGTLDVIDLGARRIVRTIDFGRGVRPHCAVFGPKDEMLYVTTELEKSITVIDPHTLKIVGAIPTGQPESHMLAISPDGRYGYTANVGPGTVSVLDIALRKTITLIPVAEHVQRISVSPDGRWAFTSDTQKPRLAVISTKANKVERWVDLPGTGYGTQSTPEGKWLLVALPGANAVGVIDLATFRVARTINVPASPQEVLVDPDGKVAYVSCSASGKVAAIQIADWSVQPIEAGHGADGLAWAK
jgi:YVTN family beta-propeller protein